MVQIVFFGPKDPHFDNLKDANKIEITALAILMFFIIAVGVYPFYMMKVIHSSVLPIALKLGGM